VSYDNQWESREISLHVNNDEYLHGLARGALSPKHFLYVLKSIGVSEIGGIYLTPWNIEESWEDAND